MRVEKLSGNKGDKVIFDKVFLAGTEGGEVKIGAPTVSGASVETEILEQGRAKKVMVVKYKRKVRYRRKVGHRQFYTKVRITKISA